jgi:hypothetical protein
MSEVALSTPLAEALNSVIRPKLVEVGWSSGGGDLDALSEYIILMLVNGKTQAQIAADLSGDLLNLGPDDPVANDFAKWLFEQVNILSAQINGGTAAAIPVATPDHQVTPVDNVDKQGDSPDTMMGDSGPESNIPTGPKTMRNNNNTTRNKRIVGQINRAMDRSSDSVLHRVRPQQGNERINMHNRNIPKGPRQHSQNQRNMGGRNIPSGPGMNPAMMSMSPQQQMQLFAMYEEQARMMAELLGPTGSNGLPAGFPPQQQTTNTRSLFERTSGGPEGARKRNFDQNRQRPFDNGVSEDPSSSMEVQIADDTSSNGGICKFNLNCTKPDCPFAHQSPAAPPGVSIDVNDECAFGVACKNRKCAAKHPSPATKTQYQVEQDCKFFPNCTNPQCPFKHPAPLCRFGADCSRSDCKFTHLKTVCKYNPCLNPKCAFKHEEGQKKGRFGQAHVSDRKFVDLDAGEEELIIPNSETAATAAVDLDVSV